MVDSNMTLQYTPIEQIHSIHESLKRTFNSAVTRPLEYRRTQLYQLARMIQENVDLFYDALDKDLRKPRLEAASQELGPIVKGAIYAAKHLDLWAKPDKPPVEKWKEEFEATVFKVPKGVALIIAPWNYPLILTLQPLIGAIAAGCPAVVKPSEVAPHFAQTLARLLNKYLDSDAYVVINGGVDVTTTLMNLPWGHLFYTGNGRVGRIVATSAAKHLTPCTLELGGQSPVVIDHTANLRLAAKRILWGKSQNSGQLCVSPNHVFIPRDLQDELVNELREVYKVFWPKPSRARQGISSKIVSQHHFDRIHTYLKNTSGTIVLGDSHDSDINFDTTIVKDVAFNDSLLQDEIFGPILAIVPIRDMEEAIGWINEHDNPLAIYVFTSDEAVKRKFLAFTSSGSLVFNDVVGQLAVHEIPFGGHGGSGYGYQHGIHTFNTFTHFRSSIDVPERAEPYLAARYAPYTEDAYQLLSATLRMQIPDLVDED